MQGGWGGLAARSFNHHYFIFIFPKGTRHGTAFTVDSKVLDFLLRIKN
jgi:hypothetical protein